jgi:xanthine dehydrogenase small subunit
LRALRRDEALRIPGFSAPGTVDELAVELEKEPGALVLAGGTDIGLWVTKQLRELPTIVYIGAVAELKEIRRDASGVEIGAAVSLTQAWRALVDEYPTLAEMAARFGSPPVRNSGTLCGNLANGSPIGDSLPVLIALDAELVLRHGDAVRRMPLERFYLGYQRTALEPGELVMAVKVPAPRAGCWVSTYKLAKRFDQDISAISVAFAVQVLAGCVMNARIAFGGMAAVAARALATERALIGAAWNESSIDMAVTKLAEDFKPLTDMRAGSAYRLQAAGNLLRRFYFEHSEASGAARLTRTADAVPVSG